MDFRRVFRKRLRVRQPGIDADSDVNVTVAANVGRRGGVTRVTSHQRATSVAGPSDAPNRRGTERTDERPDDTEDATDETSSDEEAGR